MPGPLPPDPKPDRPLVWLGRYLSLALTLPASVVAGYFLGLFLDRWLRSTIFAPIGILFGIGAGVWQVVRELNRESAVKMKKRSHRGGST